MTRIAIALITVVVLVSGCGGLGGGSKARDLFNGENLDGWVIENDGQFSVRRGLLVINRGTGWLRSQEEFSDFCLEMDFRLRRKVRR